MHEDEVYTWTAVTGDPITVDINPNTIGEWEAIDYVSTESISSSPITIDEIEWLRAKINEEYALEELAKESAAVKISLDQLKEAEHKLKVTAHLARKHG